jgi:hypothetical protein
MIIPAFILKRAASVQLRLVTQNWALLYPANDAKIRKLYPKQLNKYSVFVASCVSDLLIVYLKCSRNIMVR